MYSCYILSIESNLSFILIGTQSVRPMGLTSNKETLVSRDENADKKPEITTDSANLQLKETPSEHMTSSETCVNHRVTVSNQYECRMLSNTCGDLPTDKEVIYLIL